MSKQRGSDQHRRMIEALMRNPDGLTWDEMQAITDPHRQLGQYDRRIRELRKWYNIETRIISGRGHVYFYRGVKDVAEMADAVQVSGPLRAKILQRDGYRCRMCGRTVADDSIKLQVDHQIPLSWGGETVEENLWAICEQCNHEKKNYFSTFNPQEMQGVLSGRTVHERLANLLKIREGERVDSDLLAFVANWSDYQQDWQRRLRELKHLGIDYDYKRERTGKRTMVYYWLTKWVDLPSDPTAEIRRLLAERGENNV